MVPEGWERVPLVKIAEVRSGVAKGKSGLKDGVSVPYLRVANVQDGYIDTTELKTIEIEKSQLERYSLKVGDVLMNEGGDFDKLGRGDVWDGRVDPCLHQNHVFAVRVNRGVIEPYFLAALAASNYGKTYFLNCSKRSTNLASINSTQLKEFPVLVPPLQEQEKIAKILSTWGEAIATTEQLLANSEQQKKALMQQLLTGKKRLPGYERAWIEAPLGDLFEERKEFGAIGLPLLSVTSEQGIISQGKVGRKDTSSDDKSKYLRVCPGDIAYNTMRMWQGVSGLSSREGIVSPAYTVLKPKKDIDPRFASYLFKLPRMVHRFYRNSQGLVSDTLNLKYQQFSKIKVVVPERSEQRAIAEVLSKEDEVISYLKEQVEQLEQEKKALMQQLLTGKRRVKVDEAEQATA
ncbi:restriction endonuclease subunit S [Spiribacter halobius]|uniref:Restriction endonuclease subunit S n=1 Tax=Sediminicurvatus halobius TaxID=2182432 RepID=A0A2U2N2R6_9GAMM|nr:restriction endonuclease subunit S [Spiribacter halobius]PWG63363.1 restriction endonuclease subunit S [Spiribacter halobius]UEX78034.1 restriction endonuclease subunit S [Spiribacter halobius]